MNLPERALPTWCVLIKDIQAKLEQPLTIRLRLGMYDHATPNRQHPNGFETPI